MSVEVHDLEDLLHRASPLIVGQGRDGQLPPGEFMALRDLLKRKRQRYVSMDNTRLHTYAFTTFTISEASISDEIRDFIRHSLAQHFHNDRILTAGSFVAGMPGEGFHIDELMGKLTELTVLWGPSQAARMYVESIDEPSSKGMWISVLDGIGVAETIELYDGIRLEPIPNSASDFQPYLSNYLTTHLPERRLMGATMLIQSIVFSPKFLNPTKGQKLFSDPDPFEITGATADVRDYTRNDLCEALSLAFNTHVTTAANWWYMDDDDMANVGRTGTTGGLSISGNPAIRSAPKVSASQISEFIQLHSAILDLSPSRRKNLNIPISRLIASHGTRDLPDRTVDLGIALESIYLDGEFGELKYRLSTRAAKHLGSDPEDSLQIYNDLRVFYDKLRSKAVHTGRLPSTVKMNGQELDATAALARIQALCKQAIREVMADGTPDWEKMLLSP